MKLPKQSHVFTVVNEKIMASISGVRAARSVSASV